MHETDQKGDRDETLSILAITAFAFLSLADFASAQGVFQVSSTTFKPNSILPIQVIFNRTRIRASGDVVVGIGNECSPDGAPGENQSPQLSWTNVPPRTASFVVIMSDVTAGFTHWGMYNIPRTTTTLPQNADAAESTYGQQILNVYDELGYGGPCPPRNVSPLFHDYLFEVYALDYTLDLPPNARDEQLLLLLAEADGHIKAHASITGRYSSTPSR